MKKLISTILLGSTLITFNTSANEREGMLFGLGTVTGASIVSSVHGLAAGALSYTGAATYLFIREGFHYQGLDQESIEVLAGQADLKDQAALSLFKDDVLANQSEIEAEILAETGEEIDLNYLSDTDFAKIALNLSAQK